MAQYTERVPFRVIATECCGTVLCWVNPRLPNYCPECGEFVMSKVKSWVTARDDVARLIHSLERPR